MTVKIVVSRFFHDFLFDYRTPPTKYAIVGNIDKKNSMKLLMTVSTKVKYEGSVEKIEFCGSS